MKKLIYYEIRKLMHQKILILVFALILLLNGIFMNREISDQKVRAEKDMTLFIEEYKRNPAEMERYMAEYIAVYDAISKQNTRENPVTLPTSIYSESDRQLFSSFASLRDLNLSYDNILKTAKKTARGMIKEYDYLGYEKNAFAVVYQTAVLASYEPLEALWFPLENIVGFDLFFAYDGFCVFLLFGIALLGIRLVTEEQRVGMLTLLHTAKKGRVQTLTAKFFVGWITTVCLCALFTGSSLLILFCKIGLAGWNLPIQMIRDLQLCPLPITVGEGVLLSLGIQIVTAFTFLMMTMLLATLLKHILAVFASVIGVIGVNFAVANIHFLDSYSFFKNVNLFQCLDGTRLLSKYIGVRMFYRCFSAVMIWLVLYLAVAILSVIAALLLFESGKHMVHRTKRKRRLSFSHKRKMHHPLGRYRFEMKKLCSRFAAFVMLCGLTLLGFLSEDAYRLQRNFDDNYYAAYMTKLEGPWTPEKHQSIEADYRAIGSILSQKESMQTAYEAGTLTKEDYNRYLSESLDAEVRKSVLQKLYDRSCYLQKLHEAGYDVFYFDDTGWNLVKKTNMAWVMCLVLIIVCADVFSLESRSGFVKIQSVTTKGRLPTAIVKFFSVISISIMLGLLAGGIELFCAAHFSGLHGACYSARSMEIETSLSVFGYFGRLFCKRLLLFAILACSTALLSRLTKKRTPTLLIMTVFVFAPMLFGYFGVSVFYNLSFLNLFAG